MNRNERRKLRKNKDLVKELYSTINKYLPKPLDMFDNLTDTRNQSYVTYKIKEVSRFLLDTLTSTISDLNNLETNFQLRFDD